MKKILKEIIHPVYYNLVNALNKFKLLKQNKTLKLKGKVIINNSKFGSNVYIQSSQVSNSYINDYSYVAKDSYINNCKIGKYCCIAPNVKIGLGEHPVKDFVSIHPVFYTNTSHLGYTFGKGNFFKEYHKTNIGNDVWVGANVIIKGGVTIGDGAIIASGSIVTKNIEPYSIVGGVPAKFIKSRFHDIEIDFLKKFKWWDKNNSFLKENFLRFHDIKKLMETYAKEA